MSFLSDTGAPAHPAVIEALSKVNSGTAASYGGDDETARLKLLLKELFETDTLAIWPCVSGTAANALVLSALVGPDEAILCHREAHIERDERGAPEFFTGGAKLHLLDGDQGKIDQAELETAIAAIDRAFVHETPAACLSLTNLTECGTAYSVVEITARTAPAKAAGLICHLDGARLGNALASLDCSAADLTWRAGMDAVSFGLTKTGAMGCDIAILFGEAAERASVLEARAKRAGHMPPKLRFISAQATALLEGGLWLQLAEHANGMASALLETLVSHAGAKPGYPTDGNEVFVTLPDEAAERLRAGGIGFYPWPGGLFRFVANWTTTEYDIAAIARALT